MYSNVLFGTSLLDGQVPSFPGKLPKSMHEPTCQSRQLLLYLLYSASFHAKVCSSANPQSVPYSLKASWAIRIWQWFLVYAASTPQYFARCYDSTSGQLLNT